MREQKKKEQLSLASSIKLNLFETPVLKKELLDKAREEMILTQDAKEQITDYQFKI